MSLSSSKKELFLITLFCLLFDSFQSYTIGQNNHAIYHDSTGVYILVSEAEIQEKANQNIFPNEIVSNGMIHSKSMASKNSKRRLKSIDMNEELLDIHNEYRSNTALGETSGQPKATNMNKLMWDPYLAQVAQAYSEKCVWTHNSERITDLEQYQSQTQYLFDDNSLSVGENLFYSTQSSITDTELMVYGIQLYYDEYEYYTFDADNGGECTDICGHYTQVVWADTRYVGCGYTICNGLNGTSTTSTVLYQVCNYFPAGNYYNTAPYSTGCSCADCPSDRVCDTEGLCAGCQSLYWEYCSDYYSNCDNLVSSCPATCDLYSSNTYCAGCRTVCNTCNSSILTASETCTDLTSSFINGTVDGRYVSTPSDSAFTDDCNTNSTTTNSAAFYNCKQTICCLFYSWVVFFLCLSFYF